MRHSTNNGRILSSSAIAAAVVIDFDIHPSRYQNEIMLRDDRSNGGKRPVPARNVLGEPLEICSFKPMTGCYRWMLQHALAARTSHADAMLACR